MSEYEQFLKELGNDQGTEIDILEQPLEPTAEVSEKPETTVEDDEEVKELKPKTRRERRLIQKLNDERESAKFLANKLEAVSSARKSLDEEADYLKSIERIYGTDSPESQLATDLLKKAIVGARDDAEERAYRRIVEERERQAQLEKEASDQLESFIEEIEDTYNVELTEAQERSYFQLMEKMSPKDKVGNVIGYADPHAVWEIFQERSKKKGTGERAKQLSSRSMSQTPAQEKSTIENDSTVRFLQENGIL